ncbi:MAG: quinolinate synthase NadA [Candidatus Heimdallarchaeota archaeon]|nr:quinolinate synthase NadA [Candidatus Heimdallarchaeota archaeon]
MPRKTSEKSQSPSNSVAQLEEEIKELREKKNAVILAHNYQRIEVQAVADLLGDSLGLSRAAKEVEDADIIVFAGVYFMAETAKIVSPERKVLIPDKNAGCPLANQCSADMIKKARKKYGEDIPVIVYVNTTAETKAAADLTCTSSNSVKVIKQLNAKRVIFGPDRNLAHYAQQQLPEVEIIPIPEDGHCYVHRRFDVQSIQQLKARYPDAVVFAHPECNPDIQDISDYVGSTSAMYDFGMTTDVDTIILATEKGLVDRLNKERPEKRFLVAKQTAICYNMKKITLKKVRDALLKEQFEVIVPENIRLEAEKAIERMLELS